MYKDEQERQQNKKKKWLLLLLLLLFLVIATVVILLFSLGLQAVEPIATQSPSVVITSPEEQEDLPISLSVKFADADGEAFAYGDVALCSDPIYDVTNEYGYAFFYDIERGEHMIYAYSTSGVVLASVGIEIIVDENQDTIVIAGDYINGYEVVLPGETVVLEIQVYFSGNYLVFDKYVGAITYSGEYASEDYIYNLSKYNILTPNGNVLLQDGRIIIWNEGIIDTDGNFSAFGDEESGYSFDDGMLIAEDGSIYSSEGDKSDKDVSGGAFFGDDEVILFENSWISLPGSSSSGGGDSSPSTEDDDVVITQNGTAWADLTNLDIFSQYADENGDVMIYPGTSGTYDFVLENSTVYDVLCYFEVCDSNENYLPLEYTFVYTNVASGEEFRLDVLWSEEEDRYLSPAFEIASAVGLNFTLEWVWEFETDADGNAYDALIASGTGEELKHEITLVVHSSNDIE